MKALVLSDFDSAPALQDLPVPEPGPEQVRVRVKAAGLNKIDALISAGMLRGTAEYEFPVVLGRDAAGIVDAVGADVRNVATGDEVIGHELLAGSPLHDGTLAQYAILPGRGVARKPATVDFTTAAALPLAGATALATVDAVDAGPGKTILIAGASGGVGSYAVQLAISRGASVIATGLPDDDARLRDLGATEVVDYRGDVAAEVRAAHPDGVDGLIDLVSSGVDSNLKLAATVRDGGKVASTLYVADAEKLGERGISATNVVASPVSETLPTLSDEVDRGQLRIDVEQTLPLEDAAKGLDALAAGRARGKIVVTL